MITLEDIEAMCDGDFGVGSKKKVSKNMDYEFDENCDKRDGYLVVQMFDSQIYNGAVEPVIGVFKSRYSDAAEIAKNYSEKDCFELYMPYATFNGKPLRLRIVNWEIKFDMPIIDWDEDWPENEKQ